MTLCNRWLVAGPESDEGWVWERSFVAPLMLVALVSQAYTKVLQPSSAMVEPKQPPSPKASLTVDGKLSFKVTKCAIAIEKKHLKTSSACFNQISSWKQCFWSHLSGSREFATTASTRDLQCHGGIPACFAEGEQKGRKHVTLPIDRLFKKVWRM